MVRLTTLLRIALLAALAAPSGAGAQPVVDDWGKVTPPGTSDPPGVVGRLSPAAAERLVRAIDEAWSSGRPLRARGGTLEWIVDNLRTAFLRPDARDFPPMLGTRELLRSQWERTHRIDVLGSRVAGGHRVLLVVTHVTFNMYTDEYDPTALAIALRPDGRVTDVEVLDYAFGDACGAERRTYRVEEAGVVVAQELQGEGVLCVFAPPAVGPPGAPPEDECCAVREGDTTLLTLGDDGRFQVKRQTRLSLSGQFLDASTGEEILVEDGLLRPVRLGYRTKPRTPWKELKLLSRDAKSAALVARFGTSRTTYTLTVAEDGKSLTSVGSDGTRPQRFDWIPLKKRWERSPPR